MSNLIRWLHLSDFHVGKDGFAEKRMFEKIIEHVSEQVQKDFIPDLVFITGDVANKGLKGEYETFRKYFYNPLVEVLGGNKWTGKLFAVPGNHDLDRTKNTIFDRTQATIPGSHFFDPTKEGKTARELLSPRFKQYRQLQLGNVSANWVSEKEGAYTECLTINGRNIGIIGINTAWLSKDEHDKERLTPGFQLVESALSNTEIKKCDVCIVLGHHPLHWLIEDDARRLRTLFGRHRVIYLHGHMHRTEGSRGEGAGESFLMFQAGAAFQARDDSPWLNNGLLWGELDCGQGELRLNPRFWNPNYMDWPVETGRFPEKLKVSGGDWWAYPLPESDAPKPAAWQAPDGWSVLNRDTLQTYRRDISPEEAGRFFDGAEPDWTLAQCPKLPRRAMVNCLVEKIANYQSNERPLVVLLTGPGGEGKSMAWRQAVVNLIEQKPNLHVLWRNEDMASISAQQLQALPKGEWLIATDAADLNSKAIHQAMEGLSRIGRNDVHFLLAARESDWRAAGGESLDWRRVHIHKEMLSGLSQEDAELITRSWLAFEDGLEQGNSSTLAQKLFDAAKSEAVLGEGALLGGVLVIRKGDGLRAHVKNLLNQLDDSKLASGVSLRDAFAYIAAMHAEGLDFLSRPVLAEALACATDKLQQEVLFPLGREAAAGGGTMIRTRHRRIAMAVIDIMREEFGQDIDQYYVTLSSNAKIAWSKGNRIPKLDAWEYTLPKHFMTKQQTELAIQIAETVLERDPKNAILAVNLAKIYRQSEEPVEGARVLREFKGEVSNNRGFWYEWATCAGNAGNYALNAWLGGWSLADQHGFAPPDNDSGKRTLAGLGVAFGELFERYSDRAFIEARYAVAFLGLRLWLDRTAQHYFDGHFAEGKAQGVTPTDLQGAFERLQTGLNKAWECCAEQESLNDRIPKPQDMRFDGLKRLFVTE